MVGKLPCNFYSIAANSLTFICRCIVGSTSERPRHRSWPESEGEIFRARPHVWADAAVKTRNTSSHAGHEVGKPMIFVTYLEIKLLEQADVRISYSVPRMYAMARHFGFFYLVLPVLLSILTLFCLLSSPVSFLLLVLLFSCANVWGKYSCMRFFFSIAVLNGMFSSLSCNFVSVGE